MKRICDKCGRSGTLPEVIMVRIKAVKPFIYFYRPILGQVYSVTKAGDTYIDIENPLCKFKITGTEQIPDIPEGYRLRRKWGKDEEKIGLRDMFPTEDGWQLTFRQSGSKQESEIYITPIKQAIPDPSADKPPLGLKPRKLHNQNRRAELTGAFGRYICYDKEIPLAWIHEYNELIVEMKKNIKTNPESPEGGE